jgi:F-type H+-transporting ATPase subunit b
LLAAAKNTLKVSTLIVAAMAPPEIASAADFELFPHWPSVALNLVIFLLLIYPVNRLLIQPLLHLVEERESRTSGALDRATALETQTRETGAQIEARLNEGRSRAQARRAAILAEAEREERALLQAASNDAAGSIETVRSAVAAELAGARTALEADARTLAREAASRLLGRAI